MISPPFSKQVELFFEPSVKAIVEGIKNIMVETDPADTVRIWFCLSEKRRLDDLLVCFPRRRFWCKSMDISGSRAQDRCPRIITITSRYPNVRLPPSKCSVDLPAY